MMQPPPPPHPSKADLLADGWTFHGAGSSSATDGAADRKEKPGELVMEGSHGDLAQELCASGMLALPHVLAVMEASRSNAVVQLQGCRGISALGPMTRTAPTTRTQTSTRTKWHAQRPLPLWAETSSRPKFSSFCRSCSSVEWWVLW